MAAIPHSAAAYADTFQDALDRAEALADGLTNAQFNWRPAAGKWSVAECLRHLVVVNSDYLNLFNAALDKGGPSGVPPFRYGMVGRWFIRMVSPEAKRAMKSPAAMNPTSLPTGAGFEPGEVLANFQEVTGGLIAVCRLAEGLDLSRIRVASPFLSILKLQMGAFLEGIAGHCLRHLAQARRVTEHPDFPRSDIE